MRATDSKAGQIRQRTPHPRPSLAAVGSILVASMLGCAFIWGLPRGEGVTREEPSLASASDPARAIGSTNEPAPSTPAPSTSAPDSDSPSDAPTGRPGKLDLKLKMPQATAGIEGEWQYQPLDGSEPYIVTIRKTQKGFYEYEGDRQGAPKPVLQIDRAKESMAYRGEVGDGFDPCIPAGAFFTLSPTVDALVFEPSMPVLAPAPLMPPGPCVEAKNYVLSAKGHGTMVKLRASSDLVGGPQSPNVLDLPDWRMPSKPPAPRTDPKPEPTITLGLPSAPDGARVVLLGSLRDVNDRLYHHVRLLDLPPPEAAEGTDARRSDGSRPGAVPSSGSKGSRASDDDSVKKKSAPPAGPPTGYVPAENLIVRWECRLQHPPSAPKADPSRDSPR